MGSMKISSDKVLLKPDCKENSPFGEKMLPLTWTLPDAGQFNQNCFQRVNMKNCFENSTIYKVDVNCKGKHINMLTNENIPIKPINISQYLDFH